MLVAACFMAACVAVLLVERLALPRSVSKPVRQPADMKRSVALAARVFVIALVFAFFFAISWRPFYALVGTLSFHVVFTGISRGKYRFVREPLVFADIAMLPVLIRHKQLFYADFLGILFWTASFLYVFGVSAFFYYEEPTLLPDWNRVAWTVHGVAVALGPWLCLLNTRARIAAGRSAAAVLGSAEPLPSTVLFGTFTYVVLHFLAWMSFSGDEAASERIATVSGLVDAQSARAPVVIVWQSESFFDMRRLGVSDLALPILDGLRARSMQFGVLSSIFEGGYTMRTEFSTIAGISPAVLGPDAYFPYLRPGRYAQSAWPTVFRQAGWSTIFIHPFDRQFFRRHKAVPALGFDRTLMLDAFSQHPVEGPYVTDLQLAKTVLDLCRQSDRPVFIFVASMENHGPWLADRLGGNHGPSYVHQKILERTDAALGFLFDGLEGLDRPVTLAFYGDHAPLLAEYPDGFPDPRTDYVIVGAGAMPPTAPADSPTDTHPWTLIDDLLAAASGRESGGKGAQNADRQS